MTDPESLVLVLLREMRADIADMRVNMADLRAVTATRADLAEVAADLRSEIGSQRADVASDLLTLEKRLSDRIALLSRAVMEYHSSAIGHGVLFSEIEERVRRIESHLNLAEPGAH